MIYVVEPHSEAALALLRNLAALNLVTLRPQPEAIKDGKKVETNTRDLIEADLLAWANEDGLTAEQISARTKLIPLLLKRRMESKPRFSDLAGSISKEVGKRMIEQIEQSRNEWD